VRREGVIWRVLLGSTTVMRLRVVRSEGTKIGSADMVVIVMVGERRWCVVLWICGGVILRVTLLVE
jgi:hypothetical protein